MITLTGTPAATFFYVIATAAGGIAHCLNKKRCVRDPDISRRISVLNAPEVPIAREGTRKGSQEPANPGGRTEHASQDDIQATLLQMERGPLPEPTTNGASSCSAALRSPNPEQAALYEPAESAPCGTLNPDTCPQTAACPRWNADRSRLRQVRQNVCTGNPGLHTCESGSSSWTSPCGTGSQEPKLNQAGGRVTYGCIGCGEGRGTLKYVSALLNGMRSCTDGARRKHHREYAVITQRERKNGCESIDEAAEREKADEPLPIAEDGIRRIQCGSCSTMDSTNSTERAPASTGRRTKPHIRNQQAQNEKRTAQDVRQTHPELMDEKDEKALSSAARNRNVPFLLAEGKESDPALSATCRGYMNVVQCQGRFENMYGPPRAAPSGDMKDAARGSQNSFLKGSRTFLFVRRDTALIVSQVILRFYQEFLSGASKIFQEA